MRNREQIYGQEAAGLLRNITVYHCIRHDQLLRLYPGKEDVIENLLRYLVRQQRIFYNTDRDCYGDVPNCREDRELTAALWVLLDFIEKVEYHSPDNMPAKLVFFADGEVYEVVYVSPGKEALLQHALAAEDDSGQRLVIIEEEDQIDIPKINVYLPVQHGTDADTLEKSVGHVVGTSLPVGGSSTHAVLSAHSGMASSKLFSDIDQLTEGDTFYIHVLGDTLAYKVDAIHTVLPTDTSLLQIEDGKDYVTLVTCTPFGVNTHRLLVRGQRVPYVSEQEATAAVEKPAASSWTRNYLTGLGIGLGAAAVVGGGYFLMRGKRHA